MSSQLFLSTPIGSLGIRYSPDSRKLVGIDLPVKRSYRKSIPLSADKDLPAWLARVVNELRRYFRGERPRFAIKDLDLSDCTPFRERVYREVFAIPWGQTRSYSQIAAVAGSKGASRAVGAAMAANRYPIIVPCHRVIGADGGLCGFGGGLEAKAYLLNSERQTTDTTVKRTSRGMDGK